ncbi:malto-oligosyltrehalose trehalohydrolase [Microcoleus sp. FACHB-831]|uniref:malto-oligosyltrehalose trehalohydrolase n=1 Tax=Microcoleus sp. FACHB-831 TaxID=2692827 RepID=UPI0016868233|nr:malto-oligosyltrehalose trehalohydrolase [Microcoleus sp. FACHB-831]MBD1920971.1 malto-oligosyltrehalose trehalohydrolase [Microcoleus sp. FACHB-831]
MRIGAYYLGNGNCEFTVWAPTLQEVAVKIVSPKEHLIPMEKDEWGYWKATASGIEPGTHYYYKLEENKERPDPASKYQPKGVHGPSEVIDNSTFAWNDADWSGVPLDEWIIYELHVGTFTPEGTFEAMIPRLSTLRDLGVNAIEIMPIGQFPGDRNWGYDGVYPFAVQDSYGGPEGFKKLVDACHQHGISVILDVVYNHLGPEGNYFRDFSPYYFNARYFGEWGDAMNFDHDYSYGVRNFCLENAVCFFQEYHIDALRLDAIQGIYDLGAKHFLQELADTIHHLSQEQGRKLYITAESDLNDVRVIRPKEVGGCGIDAQWNDDFHHSVHTLLTGEDDRYYSDFGKLEQLEKSYREGFVYSGQFAPNRKRHHGSDSTQEPGYRFIVFTQTHDQIGNRVLAERIAKLVSLEGLKLGAGAVFLSAFIPFLFMGEEYGEDAPFFYFISHSDKELIEIIRKSKQEEFKAFAGRGEAPDPQSPDTFNKCKLKWEQRNEGKHKVLWEFYQQLIQFRRTLPALKELDKKRLEVSSVEADKILFLRRWNEGSQIFSVMNFNQKDVTFTANVPSGNWRKILDSADTKWMGSGSTLPESLEPGKELTIKPQSFALYEIAG